MPRKQRKAQCTYDPEGLIGSLQSVLKYNSWLIYIYTVQMNWYLPSFYCHTHFRCLENAWSMEYQLRKKSIFVEDNSIVTINSCTSRDVLLPLICDMDKLLLSVPILVVLRILKYILKKIKLLSNLVFTLSHKIFLTMFCLLYYCQIKLPKM